MSHELPSKEERDALMDALATLVKGGGATGFLAAPIVEPTDRFFPDRFDADEVSFARLARRLLRDVLFEDVKVELVDLESLGAELLPGPRGCGGGACAKPGCAEKMGDSVTHSERPPALDDDEMLPMPVGFVGIGDGVFRFIAPSIDVRAKMHLVGWTAREVTRAYRAHRNLAVDDPDLEEKLVDVTAVYLGLGVLMANEALRRHAESVIEGRMVRTTRWETQLGVLSPASFAWLLAVQVHARGTGEEDRVADLLSSEPRDAFRAAMKELRNEDVRSRMGLVMGDAGAARTRELEAWMTARIADEGDAMGVITTSRARAGRNAGRPVFRVRQHRMWLGAALGAVGGVVLTAYTVRGSVALTYLVPAAITIASGWLGRMSVSHVCSDPDCGTSIGASSASCPGCGGIVSGEIAKASDRLAAEEELDKKSGGYRDPA